MLGLKIRELGSISKPEFCHAENSGNERDRELVMLKALTMADGLPVASDPVALTDRHEMIGDEMQPRTAMAWASGNRPADD
jgi:hypothetical protein